VKITDFGISRASDDVTVTKTGLIAGTPAYLAPEVAYGKDPTPPTDVFSLGSTLYAAVEGEPPFGLSENTLGLLHAVAAGKINPPRYAGPLAPVLISLLATEAEDRPTAAQARDMLAAVARGDNPDVPETRTMFAGPPTDPRTRAINQQSPRSRTGVRPAVGGSRTGMRPSGGSRTGVRPAAAPPPPTSSKRPLIIGGVALAMLLGIGGYLIAASPGHNQPTTPSNVNSGQTTSVSAPPSVTYTTPTETSTTTTTKSTPKPTSKQTSEPPKTTTTTTTTTKTSTSTSTTTTTTSPPSGTPTGPGGGTGGH
jgi:serine/threonine protein kinase